MPKDIYQITDKGHLMELKLPELKTENQKELFFRYLSIAEHYISTENVKEAEKILINLLWKDFQTFIDLIVCLMFQEILLELKSEIALLSLKLGGSLSQTIQNL